MRANTTGRTKARALLAASIGLASAGYVACTSASSTTGAPPDGGAPGVDGGVAATDGSPGGFDGSLLSTVDAQPGGACEASTDCPSGLVCMYAVAEACSATRVCTVLAASQCAGPYCTCRGDTTAACAGYALLPMVTPLHGPPCGAASDDGGADGATDAGHD